MKKYLLAISLLIAAFSFVAQGQEIMNGHYKKALIIGAHPDDPESMCGGTMLMLKNQGCEVVCVYLTQGEGGIPGKSQEETRAIRHDEAITACEMMGVRPVFLSQVDGYTVVDREHYQEMLDLVKAEQPDLVITHWPIDSHRDHRACSLLVYDAWRLSGHSFDLYYSEVMTGLQTQNFNPTSYVDISPVRELKLKAYLCHVSQMNEGNIEKFHDAMERMRGLEYHCEYAEAFIRQIWPRDDK